MVVVYDVQIYILNLRPVPIKTSNWPRKITTELVETTSWLNYFKLRNTNLEDICQICYHVTVCTVNCSVTLKKNILFPEECPANTAGARLCMQSFLLSRLYLHISVWSAWKWDTQNTSLKSASDGSSITSDGSSTTAAVTRLNMLILHEKAISETWSNVIFWESFLIQTIRATTCK